MSPALLLVLVLSAPATATRADAERLAREGRTQDALHAFQALAEANAADVESRLWIGRLQLRLGRADLAEATFRAVLTNRPQDVEALVGLGRALLNQSQVDAALAVFERAVALAPADGDALAARGRALSRLGRGTDALASYTQAVAASPRDPEIRFGREQAWRRTSHRADVIAAHETFNPDLPAADVVDIIVEAATTDRLRVGGRAQVQRRFGATEGRGGLTLEWRADRRTAVRSSLLVSPRASSVARVDATGEIEQARGRWQPTMTLRYLDFAAAHVWVFTPGLTVDLNDAVALVGRYTRSQTHFALSDRQVGDNSICGAVRWRATPRLWLTGGYARGYESFETFSVDRLGRLRADTISLGFRIDARSGTTFAVTPEYQWRSGNRQMLRTTLAVSQHF